MYQHGMVVVVVVEERVDVGSTAGSKTTHNTQRTQQKTHKNK
jgi:hypothetical protein